MAIFVGDEKVVFELEFRDYEEINGTPTDIGALDISTATEITFTFKKPDGTTITKKKSAAEVAFTNTGVDGKARYESETGVLDKAGGWSRQGYVEFPGGQKVKSTIVNFTVRAAL